MEVGTDMDDPQDPMRVLRKAETIISRRVGKMMVVIERCTASHNYSAVIRTCEALGVQNLWVINPPNLEPDPPAPELKKKTTRKSHQRPVGVEDIIEEKEHHGYARMATKWVSIRTFSNSSECIAAMREEDWSM
jgi:tRNA G18 (ribose-2'-O)-methylase SpoU